MMLVRLLLIFVDILAFLGCSSPSTALATSDCRCLPDDPCWPTPSDFSHLAKGLSQPILNPLPPATPCYPLSHPSGDCDEVHRMWFDPSWRINQSGSMQGENFEMFVFPNGSISACYMDTSLGVPCGQGSVPVVGVDARNDADIHAAVKFVADHNLRVVVKNTGHDTSGRSSGRGSFVIWTHHLKDIVFHEQFTPIGAASSETHDNAITLGAGVQWQEAYEAVNARNQALVGGLSPGGTVGAAGGWILGGGHSIMSPTFGLGVDNVLQFTMVSSNGTRFVANAHQHTDLFFALRGGGGGTFGIVTSVTYRTHTDLPLIASLFTAPTNSPTSSPALQSLFTDLVRIIPNLADAGWGGSISVTPDSTTGNLVLSASYALFNGTMFEANNSMAPFFMSAQRLAHEHKGALTIQAASLTPFDSFFTWFTTAFPQGVADAGTNGALGSWLLPREIFEDGPEHVAQTVLPLSPILEMVQVAGGAVSRVDPDAMGVNPAWRTALVHTILATGWAEGAPLDVMNGLVDELKQSMTTLRALAPESGAYFNEASLFEPDPQRAFFGNHGARLRAIKKLYDPIDMFVVQEGIGSDEWDAALACRLQKN